MKAQETSKMTTSEMVAEYNALTGKSIKKFSSRAAGEKQLQAAREKTTSTSQVAAKKVVADKKYHPNHGCPKCGTKHDQTYAGLEGTPAGERLFCHHCGTEYHQNGKIYKKPAVSEQRSKSISDSWNDPEVAAKRGARHHVKVTHDGVTEEYKSVLAAFKALGLPIGRHIRFRVALKQEDRKTFEFLNKKYKFAVVEALQLA